MYYAQDEWTSQDGTKHMQENVMYITHKIWDPLITAA